MEILQSPDVMQGTDSYADKNTGHIHQEQRQNKYYFIEDENSENLNYSSALNNTGAEVSKRSLESLEWTKSPGNQKHGFLLL